MHHYVEDKRLLEYDANFVFSVKQDILKKLTKYARRTDSNILLTGSFLSAVSTIRALYRTTQRAPGILPCFGTTTKNFISSCMNMVRNTAS